MRYSSIPQSLFVRNRQKLCQQMEPDSLVILHSADPMRTSGDGVLPYRQESNFFYLTGINQEDSVLLLAPDHPDPNLREMLFLKESNKTTLIWEGKKLSRENAAEASGIQNVRWLDDLDDVLMKARSGARQVYFDLTTPRYPETRNNREARLFQAGEKDVTVKPLEDIMARLRMIKEEEEWMLIQKAGEITRAGYADCLKALRPGIWEYELEAVFAQAFISRASRGFAYNPIIASGANACILHYEENNQRCETGDLILLDIGAEYARYNADVTRTLPVNGRFTERQKAVYQAVLDTKKFATGILRPGITLNAYNKEIGRVMEGHLKNLGLIRSEDIKSQNPKWPAYKEYYMHGTSHHLGLDVHDLSDRDTPLVPGMVLTVEPGIYIRDEDIGIRLEDDILIGADTNTNLTPGIPIEIEEIEEMMNA